MEIDLFREMADAFLPPAGKEDDGDAAIGNMANGAAIIVLCPNPDKEHVYCCGPIGRGDHTAAVTAGK
jgi:hypothetical protein